MSFEIDICIEQCKHEKLDKKNDSWKDNFMVYFTILMNRFLGYKAVFNESDLHKNNKESLIDNFSKSKVVLLLIDNSFSNCEECLKKIEVLKSLSTETNSDNLFVIYENIDFIENNSLFGSGFKLYNFSEYLGHLTDEGKEWLREHENEFWFKMIDFSYDIYCTIDKINNIETEIDKSASTKTIYLAEVGAEQAINREILKRELQHQGYKVLPDKPLNNNIDTAKSEIHNILDESIISIHIIGENFYKIENENSFSIEYFQNNIASEFCIKYADSDTEDKLHRFIWISPDLKFSDEKEQNRIEQFKMDADLLRCAEVIQTPIELLKSFIEDKIRNINYLASINYDKSKNRAKVYLIYEKRDNDEIEKISKKLNEEGLDVINLDFANKKENLMLWHKKILIDSEAVLIYYSSNNDLWLKSKIKDMQKSPGFGKADDFTAKGILIANNTDIEIKNVNEEFIVMKMNGGFNEEILQPFIEKIKTEY